MSLGAGWGDGLAMMVEGRRAVRKWRSLDIATKPGIFNGPFDRRIRSPVDSMETKDVIILGSGPAGLTAAIYAARADLKPLVIEGSQPGGQLTITTDVENYPGFEQPIMGPELMDVMKKQAARFGTEFDFATVERVELDGPVKTLHADGKTYRARALIVATGATARWLGMPSEANLKGHGVSACATCDGFFFRDQVIVVVGGGDTALEEATFLTKFGSEVYLVHRRDELRASKAMQDRAFKNPKIEFIWNTRRWTT